MSPNVDVVSSGPTLEKMRDRLTHRKEERSTGGHLLATYQVHLAHYHQMFLIVLNGKKNVAPVQP